MLDQEYENMKIRNSEEYAEYIKALTRWASQFVVRIRAQYAKKAFEMFKNETVRKVVLAYGKEAEELDKHRVRDFSFIAEHPNWDTAEDHLTDWCLNKAHEYGSTISLLFDIE